MYVPLNGIALKYSLLIFHLTRSPQVYSLKTDNCLGWFHGLLDKCALGCNQDTVAEHILPLLFPQG